MGGVFQLGILPPSSKPDREREEKKESEHTTPENCQAGFKERRAQASAEALVRLFGEVVL
jgi:hypothetical protein